MNPEFLDIDDVIEIHRLQLAEFGGLDGIRDMGLLDSAIAQPRATFGGDFLHEDLFAMAAAYLFHMVKNHPFLDGNKRTGLLAATTFLDINGCPLKRSSPFLYSATMDVAGGLLDKHALADILRSLV